MEYHPKSRGLFPEPPLTMTPGGMSTKATVILIRWPVVLICASLILFRNGSLPLAAFFDGLVMLYALSNAALYFFDDAVFRKLKFNVALIGLDTSS